MRSSTAIETRFAGCVFRSRAEARWAAFFDALSIEWQYEPEGFDLSPNRRYLPDFELPDVVAPDGRDGVYLEVKGEQPTVAEARRCQDLARETDRSVLLAIRAPLPPHVLDGTKNDGLHWWKPKGDGAADTRYAFWECGQCGTIGVWYGGTVGVHGDAECDLTLGGPFTANLMRAYVAARSHRFGT